MSKRNPADPVLVIGATGNVGRQVVRQLLETGVTVRAMVRNPATAGLPEQAEIVAGDLTDPATVTVAARGVRAVFLAWPFVTADDAPSALDALGPDVRHVVYLSSAGADRADGPVRFHYELEQLIRRSGLEWTFLRPSGFATNTLGWAEQIRHGDVVRWPYGKATRSLIHEADIAAVAVLALTGPDHSGVVHDLTGPEQLTQIEQVEAIGAAIGRQLSYEEVPRDTARKELLANWPDEFAEGALDAWAGMVTDPEPVTTNVRDVTGRPARTFQQWATDHADEFLLERAG
ncbi:SDR family oxidoreductase [Amycolatopsis palatopharyngis]|uniref:SDR family oxidoreductase n=1 Tax=Amycolatopsis palatopharyngis TaxID=187982 RepID=UPI000E2331A5|nr:NAD(P)H-binding protein [Amycolatopsis palatopharyngis]